MKIDYEKIAAASNTNVPAYLALVKLGFQVERKRISDDNELWIATRSDMQLIGSCSLEILGLYLMRTERGCDWQASEDEIDNFFSKFYPDAT